MDSHLELYKKYLGDFNNIHNYAFILFAKMPTEYWLDVKNPKRTYVL